MKKHLQRLLAMLFAVLFAVSAFPLGVVAAGPSVIVMEHSLDETDVMFDLENMEMQKASGQKEKMNLGDFPLDTTLNETTEHVEVISLYEKGYTSENGIDSPSYGLYLYLYNPSGKKFSAFGNQANMATAIDGETGGDIYNLIDLQLLSQSEDGRFVKFKVRKTNGYFPCLIGEQDGVDYRSYIIGSLTLSDGENRKSYKVGMAATYSGLEADNTLAFSGKEIDVLEIEVHHTSYLLDSSPLGEGHRSVLNSCYFAIPESIIQRSGQLTNVKAEWYEYKTNPIPIFAKKEDYDYYSQFVAKDLSKEENFGLGLGHHYNSQPILHTFDYLYGTFKTPNRIVLNEENGDFKYMPTVFYNPKASQYGNDLLVKGEDLLTDLRLNSSQFVRGLKTQIAALEKKEDLGVFEVLELEAARSQLYGKNGNYYSGFFQDVVDDGRQKGYNVIDAKASTPIDLKSFEGDWWAKLMEYGISYPDVNNSVTYPTIESIRDIVHDTSHSLGVNQRDLEELKNYSEKMEVFGYRPYIFRFAVTDSEVGNIVIEDDEFISFFTNGTEKIEGMYFSQTVFLDFQVIEMTFTKEHEQTTIDTRYTVVSDPEDVTPDVEQRPEEDNNLISDAGIGALGLLKDTAASSLNWLGDFLFGNDAFSIIKKVIGIIVIILLVRFVLIPVIRWLFSKIKKKDKPEKTIAVNETKKDTEKKE